MPVIVTAGAADHGSAVRYGPADNLNARAAFGSRWDTVPVAAAAAADETSIIDIAARNEIDRDSAGAWQ
jgi:hypothetical protein